MEEIKKKQKRKSLSAQLKAAQQEIKRSDKYREEYWNKWMETRKEVLLLQQFIPKKYYRIKFKIMAVNELVYEFTEIITSYCAESAINQLKDPKKYPDTFELLDITLLGE